MEPTSRANRALMVLFYGLIANGLCLVLSAPDFFRGVAVGVVAVGVLWATAPKDTRP